MFRTELTIAPAARPLSRTARVLTLGSCFADSIGQRLTDNKVRTLVNPFGTAYQPLALARLLRAAAGDDVDWPQHLVEARGRWQTYDLPGRFGADSPDELLQRIDEEVYHTGTFLRQADVVLLTLGTAWAYRLRETGELVNNCHKLPAEQFERELLTADDIVNALAETHAYLKRINPKLRMILTVSPVRHLRDTLPLNAVSKGVLRVACHYLSELLPDVAYFPAYELLVDDLRDYRFYGSDMLHPSAVAEDYIWDKFASTYFDANFTAFRREWNGLRQALNHRPLYDGAPEYRRFLGQTAERLGRLAAQGHDVGHELAEVQARVAALPEPRPAAVAEPEDDGQERIDIGVAPAPVAKAAPEIEYHDATGRTAALQALEDAADARAAALDEARQRASDRAAELASLTNEATPGPPAAPAPQAERPGRLSPEEFRQQRAERGRGGRNSRRNGRNTPAAPVAEATIAAPTAETVVPVAAGPGATAPLPAAAEGAEMLKKKKRRSRGGAKRTARKNAARLAEAGLTTEAPAAPAPTTAQPAPAKPSAIQKSEPNLRSQRQKRPTAPAAPLASLAPVPGASTSSAPAAAPAAPSLAETVLGLKPKAATTTAPTPATTNTAPPTAKPKRRRPNNTPDTAAATAAAVPTPAAPLTALPATTPVTAAKKPKTTTRKANTDPVETAKAAPTVTTPPATPAAPTKVATPKKPTAAKKQASASTAGEAAAAPQNVPTPVAKKSAAKASVKVTAKPEKKAKAPAKSAQPAAVEAATPAPAKAAKPVAQAKTAKAAAPAVPAKASAKAKTPASKTKAAGPKATAK